MNEQLKNSLARFNERKKEMANYSTEADLKKMREASKPRQKESEAELILWQNISRDRWYNGNKKIRRVEKYKNLFMGE